MIWTVASWIGVVLVLGAYASGHARLFHWANVTLCVPVAAPAFIANAYSSASISIAFGIIGGYSLWKDRNHAQVS